MINCHEATLPIDVQSGLSMDSEESRALGSLMAMDYREAMPFRHIVIDRFLPVELITIIENGFPDKPLKSDRMFEMNYAGHHKRQILPDECSSAIREVFSFFNSRAMLQFLEGLTGIDGLIPDAYFEGGGFHEITRGGLLGVHADFRINQRLHLQRRLNVLIYLNKDWNSDWGGHLELWSRDMQRCESSIAPLHNRCVVFNTDADSFHGHPEPLQTPEEVKRRSLALYYYTASRSIHKEVVDHSTMYHARPSDHVDIRREAWRLRRDQYLKDWLPPRLARLIHNVRHRLSP